MNGSVEELYELRFNNELAVRNNIWRTLCSGFFQKYVKRTDAVCDVGAGYCEFINNIDSKYKYAVDINPSTKKYAAKNVKVILSPSTNFSKKLKTEVDVIFTSNFLEHLSSKNELIKTIVEFKKVLKDGGKLIVLMPNIKYVGESYWDFLDHQLPLTDKSVVEGLQLSGFKITECKSRFLPYTTKSVLPKATLLVKLYLLLPPLQLLLGKQSLIVATK